tara:strand:+ start:1002 stop:1247 length:246 start_codon:yes stop_codon:yes gene_type:complete
MTHETIQNTFGVYASNLWSDEGRFFGACFSDDLGNHVCEFTHRAGTVSVKRVVSTEHASPRSAKSAATRRNRTACHKAWGC